MKKTKSSKAIIVKNDRILLVNKKQGNRSYYLLPGGDLNKSENPDEALVREVKRETNLDVISFKKFTEIEDDNRYCYYYFVDRYIGEIKIGTQNILNKSTINQHELEWIKNKDLRKINLKPIQIKERLVNYLT